MPRHNLIVMLFRRADLSLGVLATLLSFFIFIYANVYVGAFSFI
ncbi:MAG: hypothetical protein JWQ66_1617 [Mucilaginibacter sp.]|nr:hypothetical protein [Mucilaginibacter sp.]